MGSPSSGSPRGDVVSARLPLAVLMAAERKGVRRSEILKSAGVSFESLIDEDARVSLSVEQAIWLEATARTRASSLGLEVLRSVPPGFLGLPELLFSTASTFGDALEVAGRYMALLRSGLTVGFATTSEGQPALSYRFSGEASELARGSVEAFLSALVVLGKGYAGRLPRIERLSLSHPAPKSRAEVDALIDHFGTRAIEFGSREPCIVLDRDALAWPLLTAAPRLHRLLRGQADLVVQELPRSSSFVLRSRQHLLAELEGGKATLSGLARRLRVSERTMQRRLAAEGSSFGDLLNEVRRDLAPLYLREPTLGLSEIAFRLGFASPQSFHRAFHAWTGKAPGAWRRENAETRRS